MKNPLFQLVKEAGEIILNYYGDKSFSVKKDQSPVTEADQASHDYLTQKLSEIKDIPVLSEEKIIAYENRKTWPEFWMIDPLDGTKEFLNAHDDFCINIALIKENKPVLGIIYAPALNELYWAEDGKGFEYFGPQKQEIKKKGKVVVALSRSHHSDLTEKFMEINNLTETKNIGAALKFGRMAIGQVDLYPRFEGSKEWDTAAGQIILKESEANIVDLTTFCEPVYNKICIKNNFFLAYRSSFLIDNFELPELA